MSYNHYKNSFVFQNVIKHLKILGISTVVLLTMLPFDRTVCFLQVINAPKTYCTHNTRETTIWGKKHRKKQNKKIVKL